MMATRIRRASPTSPAGLAVNITYNRVTNVPVNAGSYTVRGVITNQNYQEATPPLVIAKAGGRDVAQPLSDLFRITVTGISGHDTAGAHRSVDL